MYNRLRVQQAPSILHTTHHKEQYKVIFISGYSLFFFIRYYLKGSVEKDPRGQNCRVQRQGVKKGANFYQIKNYLNMHEINQFIGPTSIPDAHFAL